MKTRSRWEQALTAIGCGAMLLGGLDPLEGSLAVLAGSGLFALAAHLGQLGWEILRLRLVLFGMIAAGVGALWGLTIAGGVGGKSGHSPAWALLTLPYLVGWSVSLWSRGAPRWFTQLGIVGGLWYLAIVYLGFTRPRANGTAIDAVLLTLGTFGLLTAAACAWRLWRTRSVAPVPPA